METHIFLLLVFSVKFVLNQDNQWDPIVGLTYGQVRGRVLKSTKNRPYYAFQDVPFAKPPIGDLRFKESQPPESWTGVKNTTENKKKCVEFYNNITRPDAPTEDEDCLYTNVYTPQLPNGNSSKSLLPVFVAIYGGQFIAGNGDFNFMSPGNFMDFDLIIMVPSYRLGPIGFLYENNNVFSGNLGLKDISDALKWANQNIARFGGDPNKITLGGISAGAAAAAYQIISERSKGLFRGAIIQSGTTTIKWALQKDPKQYSRKLVKILNPDISSNITSEELLRVLRNAEMADIIKAHFELVRTVDAENIWMPVIENENSEDPFVTKLTLPIWKKGNFNRVSAIVGYTSEEYAYYSKGEKFMSELMEKSEIMDKDSKFVVDEVLDLPEELQRSAGAKMKKVYTNKTFVEDPVAFIKLFSSNKFKNPTIRHAEFQSKYSDVYLYQLSHKGPLGYQNRTIPMTGLNNVVHAEDETYLYGRKTLDSRAYPTSDRLTQRRILRMWANFIIQMDPTPKEDPLLKGIKWPKFNQDQPMVLNINNTLSIDTNFNEYLQWKAVMENYESLV